MEKANLGCTSKDGQDLDNKRKTDEKRARGEVGGVPEKEGAFREKAEKGKRGQIMDDLM